MNRERRESHVDVGLDPSAAFAAFTDELDYWWLRGPINNWDSSRVREMRLEHGIGGRLLEIYDEPANEMLELARITAWEPGERLAWRSSVDDVRVDVTFQPIAGGTRVRLTSVVPPEGKDAGGSSFLRVAPAWFGRWAAGRNRIGHRVQETGRLAVAIHYRDPATAAHWLHDAFGIEPVLELDEGAYGDWIEFRVGDAALILLGHEADGGGPTSAIVPWVFVDDLDAHHAAATAAGVRIVRGIEQHGYRAYAAEDLEGNRWTFAQARPTMR